MKVSQHSKRDRRNRWVRPLLIGGIAILAADLARRLYRLRQVFEPSSLPIRSWRPADYGIPDEVVEEHAIETPDGQILQAWYCRARREKASLVFCHGNTGNLTMFADIVPFLLDAGCNVLLFDYRGYGKSSGTPTFRGVVADGVTAARFHDRIRPRDLPSVLYGYSLGGAIAAQVIRRHAFDGLILQSTFTSLADVARVAFPKLPLHLLAGDLFDTRSAIRRLSVPLLVLHGSADEVCPVWMGHDIMDVSGANKRFQSIEGGLHKDLYVRDPDMVIWAISEFIAGLPGLAVAAAERESWLDAYIDEVFRAFRRRVRFRFRRTD
jgi:fermentation-respiration switch protein FrsA (DUF1100 family)